VLDIDVVEAALDGLEQHATAAILLPVGNSAALGLRTAAEDQGLGLGPENREQIEVLDQVAANLEQVGDACKLPHPLGGGAGRRLGEAHANLDHLRASPT